MGSNDTKTIKDMTPELEQMTRELAEKWMPMVRYKDKERFIECLTSLLDKQREVDMEFTRWISFHSTTLYYRDVDEKWIKTRFEMSENPSEEYDEYTTDELHDYWLKNVKK